MTSDSASNEQEPDLRPRRVVKVGDLSPKEPIPADQIPEVFTDEWLGSLRLGQLDELRIARVVGLGVAGTLGAIDAVYVPKGRISAMYLQDLVCEVFWVAAWRRACRMS